MTKKKTGALIGAIVLICVLLFFGGCKNPSGDNGPQSVPVTGVAISPDNPQVIKGQTLQLQAAVSPDNATDKSLTWTSSAPGTASVSSGGLVSGLDLGTAVITAASADGPNDTVTVTVIPVPVTDVTIKYGGNPVTETLYIEVGSTESLSAEASPAAASQDINWSSSDEGVATVSNNGTVTAVAAGTATITAASATDSAKKGTCTVEVVAANIALNGITLNPTSLDLTKGGPDGTLTVIFDPSNFPTARRGITWESDDDDVATVSNGIVHPVGGGIATITATSTADSSVYAECPVEVSVPLTGITLSPDPLNLDFTSGSASGSLTPAYIPSDTTTAPGVTWESSNPAVATVSNGTVTAVGTGTAIITATSTEAPGINGTATVNVIIPVTGISLDQATLNLTKGGADGNLTVSYAPPSTTQTGVTWSSAPPGKVEIIGSGDTVTVHAIGGGETTITATSTADSNKTATCTVTVSVPLTGITLSQTSLDLIKGGSDATLSVAAYIPSDTTTAPGVTWLSNNTAVATVIGSGNSISVHAVGGGTTTITATSTADSSVYAECPVEVSVPLTGITLSQTSLTLTKGGANAALSVTAYSPADTTDAKAVTWESDDTAVATVIGSGDSISVHAVGGGTTTITATAVNGVTADCEVTVSVPLTGISIPSSLTLGEGTNGLLPVTYTPSDTTETEVTWSSGMPSVATVDDDGIVHAAGIGSATITATSTANGSITASCNVTVQASFNGAGIQIDFEGFEDETITLGIVPQGTDLVISAPSGYVRYMWYVDGLFRGITVESDITYSSDGVAPGLHYLTVIVEKTNGSHFSKTVQYTVGY